MFRVSVQSPNERDNKGVVRPRMAELMPPILSDCFVSVDVIGDEKRLTDLILLDLVLLPQMLVDIVKEDCLEYVILEGLLLV